MSSQSIPAGTWKPQEAVAALARDRLFRNGGLLTLSSFITSAVGVAYWAVAARGYGPAAVGRNSAALSAMMFIAGLAQLNLMSALVRFIPVSGSATRSLVARTYAVCAGTALVLAVGFLASVGWLAPGLRFLTTDPPLTVWFVVSTIAWGIFVLQDSVLTGLRRTWLVPVENAVYALVKLVLVAAVVSLLPDTGIFVSWTAALLVTVVPINAFLFRRAIPSHEQADPAAVPAATAVVRFAAGDYGGAVAWLAALNLLPLMVLQMAGPAANGFYAVAWVMAYSLYLVSGNLGVSLVVETAAASSSLASQCRNVVQRSMTLMVPATAVLVAAAPWILRIFGPDYSAHGTWALRLLLLSAIPNIVTATSVSSLRARRLTSTGTVVLVALAVMVFGLSALFLPRFGIAGVGLAWLLAQSVTAAAVLTVPSLWPREADTAAEPHRDSPDETARPGLLRRFGKRSSRNVGLVEQALAHALRNFEGAGLPALGRADAAVHEVRTFSEVRVATVGSTGDGPLTVLKVASSPAAAAELAAGLQAVSELAGDDRLAGWRSFLPVTVLSNLTADGGYLVEKYIGGLDGRALDWRDPEVSEGALSAAAGAIDPLHQRSGRLTVLDRDWVDRWVVTPASIISTLYRPGSQRIRSIGRLQNEIVNELLGRPAVLGWVHGDYTPGNLILDPAGTHVRGILDWGGAAPNGPAYLDTGMLVLSARMLRDRRELGAVLVDLLRHPLLSVSESDLLGGARRPSYRTQLMMCWLHHLARNLTKAPYYRTHLLWRSRNVDPVLAEAARW